MAQTHCQITSDSLDNFYCVAFWEVFTGCISDYCSLFLLAWKFVQPPCAERCCVSTVSEHLKPEPPLRSPIKCNFSQSKLPGLCRDSSHPHQDDTVSTLGLSQHVDSWQPPKENKGKSPIPTLRRAPLQMKASEHWPHLSFTAPYTSGQQDGCSQTHCLEK